MYDRGKVELVLSLLAEGATPGRAAREAGVSRTTARNWAAGRVPHERPSGRIRVRREIVEVPALNAEERAAYDAAMEENALLKAVLDDLKAAGSAPASTSRRRCVELGERLRAETGLPLTRILAFLGISKSSYEYHRARLGEDRHAALRPLVAGAFEACGRRGYRAVHAQLRRGGVRVSEKVVRRLMREQGLAAWNRYRSQALGRYWQDNGLTVVPTLSWAQPESYTFCFEGVPRHSTVATSTVGVKGDADALAVWMDGMREAMRRVEPSRVLLYGGDVGFDFGDAEVVYYKNPVTERMGNGR